MQGANLNQSDELLCIAVFKLYPIICYVANFGLKGDML
jgi:hypothetical protein